MIIAFKTSIEGVLAACDALQKNPDAELVFAKNEPELEQKLIFSGVKDKITVNGFSQNGCTINPAQEFEKILGKWPKRMSRMDPGPVKYIDMILRHKNADPAQLVRLLVSCNGSMELLFSKKTRLSRKYYGYMREVTGAYQRMCMLTRPDFVNNILTVEIKSRHDVDDIFCRWLAKKNPDIPVAVIHGSTAWIGNGELIGLKRFVKTTAEYIKERSVSKQDNENMEMIEEEIEELWDIYYNSQMIETRRNRTLAKKLQPKGASTLSKMAKMDRYKVEHGIAHCTLDDF